MKTKNKVQVADAYNSLGISFTVRGQNEKAIANFKVCLALNKELKDLKGEGAAYNNIGMVYNNQGDFSRAISYYDRSLKIDEKLDDDQGRAASLGNIGNIYVSQREFEKALEYHQRSLELDLQNEDERGIANTYNNLSVVLKELERYDEAIEYATECLIRFDKIDEKHGKAIAYDNLGSIYHEKKNYDKALEWMNLSLTLKLEIKDDAGIALLCSNFGRLYNTLGDYEIGINWCLKGLNMADTLEIIVAQRENCLCLYKGYKLKNDKASALDYYEQYQLLHDSTVNEQSLTSLISQEYQFTYEKDKLRDSLEFDQHRKLQQAELDYGQKQKYWLYAGLFLLAIVGLLAYRSFRLKKRDNIIISAQKKKVELQKLIVDEKN
ncbi:MAG: tetratricopeptide repeat protein, partial [Flavobacteriales bacterium]|nr:tetratricopeptide repeat protein [Flavobacteriales bacterium]